MLRIPENLIVQKMGEKEYVLVLLPKGTYYLVKGTGADIWDLFSQGIDKSSIIQNLLKNYDIDQEHATSSVTKFFETLQLEGLIINNEN